ncbi:MAG TPA: DUF1674 domain-containing protein [Afipia sp.]
MTDKQAQSPETSSQGGDTPPGAAFPRPPLPPAAQRALAEAEARRAAAADNKENIHSGAKEIQGPSGPEPTRYGDWEIKGIASDF